MANSKRKLLLNYLRDTLFPSIDAGATYNTTVQFIERGIRAKENMDDSQMPALFIVAADEDRENLDGRVNFQSRINAAIVGYVKDADGNPGKIQEAVDDLIEDVTKALYTDISQGARCLTTEIRQIKTDAGDLGPYGGFVMEVEFMYASATSAP